MISKCGEFNKTIIPFALIGYEIGYSQLGATRLVGYLPSHIDPTHAHGIIVKCMLFSEKTFNDHYANKEKSVFSCKLHVRENIQLGIKLL